MSLKDKILNHLEKDLIIMDKQYFKPNLFQRNAIVSPKFVRNRILRDVDKAKQKLIDILEKDISVITMEDIDEIFGELK